MDEKSPNLICEVLECVEDCFQKAEKHFKEKIPRCKVSFDLTGTRAGTANWGKKLIRFNRKLLIDNKEFFLKDTCPHEVAHIVQFWKHWGKVPGLKPHGNEWKKIMVEVFRLPPKRCHNLSVEKVKRKTKEYRYLCRCHGKNHMFGLIKHKRAQAGNAYHCLSCGEIVRFDGKGLQKKVLQETILD